MSNSAAASSSSKAADAVTPSPSPPAAGASTSGHRRSTRAAGSVSAAFATPASNPRHSHKSSVAKVSNVSVKASAAASATASAIASASAAATAAASVASMNSTSSPMDLQKLQETILQLLPGHPEGETDAVTRIAADAAYLEVMGPADVEQTCIHYDLPYAPGDPKRSLKLRHSLGRPAEERVVDPNVRIVIDSFITPRRWVDEETQATWVQHASPFPANRVEAAETLTRLREQLTAHHTPTTGTSPMRSLLVAECALELLRQVTADCWERGLVLLHVHTERVAAQAAHRRLFESRVGHAFRLALKGEKDVLKVEEDMAALKARVELLEQEEAELRRSCGAFEAQAEEAVLIANKKHNDALVKLKKENAQKKAQLELQLITPANLA